MWDSWWLSATEAELIPSYFQFLLLVIISSLLQTHLFLRCAPALPRQHIITSSVCNEGSSTLSQYLAGCGVRNFSVLWGGICNTWSGQWSHVMLCFCSYATSQHRKSTRQMANWPTLLLSACMVKLKTRNICNSQWFKTRQRDMHDHFTIISTAYNNILASELSALTCFYIEDKFL
jgi:hypothetical protein